MGAVGAGIGALIGAGIGSSPNRRPVIPISRHVVVDPAVSPSRVSGALKISF
jgi:hypothetical protein